jgi:hypothetical protein
LRKAQMVVNFAAEKGWAILSFYDPAALHASLIKSCRKRGYAAAEHAYDHKEGDSASTAGCR